jgi:hypothetical protein
MRRINRTRTAPVSFYNILLRRSRKRLRVLSKVVTPGVLLSGNRSKQKFGRIHVCTAHPDDLPFPLDDRPVCSLRAHDVETVQHFCNFFGTSTVL